MHSLTAEQLLALWERAAACDRFERPLLLWQSAGAEGSIETLAELPVGQRDAALMQLRRALYGSKAPCYVECPACDEAMELKVNLDRVLACAREPEPGPFSLKADDWTLRFRLVTTADLRHAARATDSDRAQAKLLARCVLGCERAGDPVDVARIDEPVRKQLADEIERLDPHAEVSFLLRCHACGHAWSTLFDISSYLWREIELEAKRLLEEVAALARSFGWREADVLALSGRRRRAYLELAGVV